MLQTGIVAQIVMNAFHSDGIKSEIIINQIELRNRLAENRRSVTVCNYFRIEKRRVLRAVNFVSFKIVSVSADFIDVIVKRTFRNVVPIKRYAVIAGNCGQSRRKRRVSKLVIVFVGFLNANLFANNLLFADLSVRVLFRPVCKNNRNGNRFGLSGF